MKHALLGASSANRWLNCTPSAWLERSIPDESGESEFAREGTQAHALAETKLRHWQDTGRLTGFESDIPEMEEHTESYVRFVVEKFTQAKRKCPDAKLFIEESLHYESWVPGGFGTGDAIIIADGLCTIIDLKYGKGVRVSATENPQLKLYAAGTLSKYDALYDISEFELIIYQPRINNISHFLITRSDLEVWLENEVRPKADLAYSGQGEYIAGDWCRFCKAKGECRTRTDSYVHTELKDPALLSDDEIAQLLTQVEQISSWCSDVKEAALKKALDGHRFKGFKVVEGKSIRKYTDEKALAERLRSLGYDESKYMEPAKLKGLTKLSAALGSKVFKEVCTDFIYQPKGKPALAEESDRRPEWRSAQQDFEEELKNGQC